MPTEILAAASPPRKHHCGGEGPGGSTAGTGGYDRLGMSDPGKGRGPRHYMHLHGQHRETIMQHGLRLGCDATHEISNSKVKLFALGWLAQHDDAGVIRNIFIPLAFALAPSEDGTAAHLLLQSTDGYLKEACGFTLNDAKVAHPDGGTGRIKSSQDCFRIEVPLARSLQHIERNIQKEGVTKLRRTSWWDTVQRWVSFSAFLRSDSLFDRFWHHAFPILRQQDEEMFEQYLASDILSHAGGKWTAWRAGPLEPGYRPHALNSADSFFKVLDHYVPDESLLSLTEVVSKYEHVGRVFKKEREWSQLCFAVSMLSTPAIFAEIPNTLSERPEHFHGKQIRRMSVAGIKRVLESGTHIRVEVAVDGATRLVFCKYQAADFDEQKMRMLAKLETTENADQVDACLLTLEALTQEADGTHFHPRVLRALYVQFTAVYKYLHSASPAKALVQAEKSYGQAAEDLMRPNSTWSFASAQKEFVTELAQEMRQELALTEERQRTAQTQRATADIIGKIQTQMDYLAGKLRQSSTGGPWMFWTSYRLPGTPIFVSGRYQDGRTNIELNLAPNK
ncbi:unnamed protein product, partial [Symbiodinium sp. CCMP2592]